MFPSTTCGDRPASPLGLVAEHLSSASGLEPSRAVLGRLCPCSAVMPVLSSSPDFGRFCFPGLKKMQSSLKLVDCILEVHDARISFGTCDAGVFGRPIFSPGPFLHSV